MIDHASHGVIGDSQSPSAFAHAAEEEFARLMDFYGVQWIYEPRTFVLRTDSNGNPAAAFTPDFYLPEEDLYVEITTVRPNQVRRKNRKIRWLNEQYPEINIKLYKRSDFRQLMAKHGLDDDARAAWIGLGGQGEANGDIGEMRETGDGKETRELRGSSGAQTGSDEVGR